MNVMDQLTQARPADLDRRPAPERRAANLAVAIAAPRPDAVGARRLAWPSRTSHRIALAGGVAALAGGAAAAIALAYAGAPVTAAHQSPSAQSAASLRAAMLTAFDGVSCDIYYTRAAQGPGIPVTYELSYPAVPNKGQLVRIRQYTVPASEDWEEIFRQDVNPRLPNGSVEVSTRSVETIDVEYGNHTWSKTFGSGMTLTSFGPAALRQEIADGKIGSITATKLDGRPVLKVTVREKQGPVDTFWVDPATDLTLQTTTTGGGRSLVEVSEYLPPTAANLAKLNLTVPAGFKRTRTMQTPAAN